MTTAALTNYSETQWHGDFRRSMPIRQAPKFGTDVYDSLGFGLIRLETGLKSKAMNALGATLLRHPSPIYVEGGHLRCHSPRHESILLEAIQLAKRSNRAISAKLHCSEFGGATIIVFPSAVNENGTSSVNLVIQPSAACRISLLSEKLKSRYKITTTECEIFRLIVLGLQTAEIAQIRGTSKETVRSQVKSLSAKTGCQRQAQLFTLANSIDFFEHTLLANSRAR